jgi:bifunctional DNA-binding transcriptional regulator/antitoxin component of YhaV-PrlF toxin-antitoxin module
MTAETLFASVSQRGTMSLPPAIRRRFHLDSPGAQVAITVRDDDGVIELRPHLAVPTDQLWYWTDEWQAKERIADEQIAAGQGTMYESGEAFIDALRKLP